MTALGYETTLVRGAEGPREGSMDALADNVGSPAGADPALVVRLGQLDLRALGEILRLIRALRPDIVHTHAAKAAPSAVSGARQPGSASPDRPYVSRPRARRLFLAA